MPRFRKRPVVVEAEQYDGSWENAQHLIGRFGPELEIEGYWTQEPVLGFHRRLVVRTPEGTMIVGVGDWIIRGIRGEVYPCKPDIFEATYEPAGEVP